MAKKTKLSKRERKKEADKSPKHEEDESAPDASESTSSAAAAPSKKVKDDQPISQEETTKSSLERSSNPESFRSLQPALSKGVLDFVEARKFHTMTPVQAATMPLFLTHKDVAVQACTGSGKTLAFLIPIVEMILRRKPQFSKSQVAALVLSPTRELAQQTYTVAQELCRHVSLPPPLLLVGGSGSGSSSNHRPVTKDLEIFQRMGSDIIIGTPGRVEDVLTRYLVMDTSELECLVLDEADVLLRLGFSVTLTSILSKLPKMRRTGLFSATANGLKELIPKTGMRNPVAVNVAVRRTDVTDKNDSSQVTPASLQNYYIVSTLDERLSRLVAFLKEHRNEKLIVFFLTCACVEFFGAALQELLPDFYIELLHGKMVQKRREKAMERFRLSSGESSEAQSNGGILCCTDVAARGLDVSDINWVVQFDAPQDPSFYVHRVGRTGRAGRKGASLLFLTRKEESYVDLLELRKVPLTPLSSEQRCAPPPEDGKSTNKVERKIASASDPNLYLPDVLPAVKAMVMKDRDLLEKGTRAFTSYIRAYKEHKCVFIFRFASLDLGLLATSFCLLRLPKMPELRDIVMKGKDKTIPNFQPAGPEVDIHAIPYKDKVREKARQKRLEAELKAGGKNAKQILAEQRKAERLQKEKDRRSDAIAKGRNPDKKRGRNAQLMDEWDDLAKEERLYKKLRRGKISQADHDEQLFGPQKTKKRSR